jgi:2-polyprenyl-3-methyl-5-hydroxy-6-metoxy-1,4-benzoquinol methylase
MQERMGECISEDTYSENYADIYELLSKVPLMTDPEEVDFFANLVLKGRKARILDLGCAEGRLAVRLAKDGHRVVAADISSGYLAQTAQLAKANNLDVEVVQCDIEKDVSVFGGRGFDYVFFMDVIEHVRSPIGTLENIRRLMAEDGVLFINTPNANSLWNLVRSLFDKRRTYQLDPAKMWTLHLQAYDYMALQDLCNFAGLRILRQIPTVIEMPKLLKSRFLARLIPAFQASLLVECRKCERHNVAETIEVWADSICPNR